MGRLAASLKAYQSARQLVAAPPLREVPQRKRKLVAARVGSSGPGDPTPSFPIEGRVMMRPRPATYSTRSATTPHAVARATRVGMIAIFLAAMSFAPSASALAQSAPGGFLETADTASVRPPSAVALPSRGAFAFPAPYNTTGIRLTNESDCGGADCLDSVGYSYWRNINSHVGSDTMYVFLVLDR